MTPFDKLVTWLGEWNIRSEVDRVLAYRQVPEAHTYIQDRQNFGKVLLDFWSVFVETEEAPSRLGQ